MWKEKRNITGHVAMLGLLVVVLLSGVVQTSLAAEVVFGMQLNDDAADSYGSSMAYDARTHRLYITGGTYSGYFKTGVSHQTEDTSPLSDCFFGVLQLPQQVFMSPQWIRRVQIGMPDVAEACSSLYVSQKNGDIYLLGHSVHSASVMSSLTATPSLMGDSLRHPTATAAGLVMHLSRGANLVGGMVMENNAVQYPIAIQGDEDSDHLFVASVKSTDSHMNPSFVRMKNRVQNDTRIDMSTAGYLPPEYGSNFTILLKSLQRQTYVETMPGFDKSNLRETLEPVWSREFGLDMPKSLQVSDLIYVSPNILIMAGSTHGSIPTFDDDTEQALLGEDWDGFLLGIDPATGDQLGSQRIRSLPQGDDRILGLCKSESNTTEEIYMVGITEGSIDYYGKPPGNDALYNFQKGAYRAFILKMNARTMETQWISYVGATYDAGVLQKPQVHGMACAVTADGADVYLSGTVKDGAVLFPDPRDAANVEAEGHGGDDIFVAQYKALDGKLSWAKQLGTVYDDSLSQGVGLVTNTNGDAIVLGNTNGSLMRKKASPSTTDMFVLSLARKRGHHLPFYEMMMDTGPTHTYEGFSKSTNPYYFDSETDQSTINASSQSTDTKSNDFAGETSNEVSQDEDQDEDESLRNTTQGSMSKNVTIAQSPASRGQNGTVGEQAYIQNQNVTILEEENSQSQNQTTVSEKMTASNVNNQTVVEPPPTNNDTNFEPLESNASATSEYANNISALEQAQAEVPGKDPEQPSEEPENEAIWYRPSKPLQPEEMTSASDTDLSSSLPPNATSSIPPNATFEIDTPGPSPNLRTQRPASTIISTRPPLLTVVVTDSGEEDDNEGSNVPLPLVLALVALANVIVAVGLVLIYLYRKQGGWRARIVPGLDDEPKSAGWINPKEDISVILAQGRWKADGSEYLQDESESSVLQDESESGSYMTVDGQLLMELRPPAPPPMPPLTPPHPSGDFSDTQRLCQSILWGRTLSQPVSIQSQSSFSMVDSFDGDIMGDDKYDNGDTQSQQ